MTDSLRAEVLPPRAKSVWLLLASPLVASLALLSTCDRTERMTVFVPPALPKIATPAPPPRVISSELKLVFRDSDRSYVHLGSADVVDMATAKREWLGKQVYVDNDCTATITGFKVINRLAYDGEPIEEDAGVKVVGAELDRCDGTYARSASLPKVVVPETRPDDAELVKKAKRLLVRSAAADETARVWLEDYQSQEDWKTQAQYDIRTLRHPLTNQMWISMHAWNETGCGDAGVNIWGLFRVEADGSVTATQLRDLGDMTKISHVIDIEGDGELELIGTPWLGLDVLVTRATGLELERLPLPYTGCPC
jgi:hypothetical protein